MSDETTKQLFIDYLLCENSCLKTQCSQTSELLQTLQFNIDMLNNVIENTFDVSGNMSSFVRIQVYDNSGNVVSCVTTDCCGNFIPCMEFDSSGNILPCVLPPMMQALDASAGSRGFGLYGYPYGYGYDYPYGYGYPYGYLYGHRYGYPYDYYPYDYLLDDCYRDLSCASTSATAHNREFPPTHSVPYRPVSVTKPHHPMPRPPIQKRLIISRTPHIAPHQLQKLPTHVHPAPMHPIKPMRFHKKWGRHWGRYSGVPHF